MLVNNSTRIARLSLNTGPLFDHHTTYSALPSNSKSSKRKTINSTNNDNRNISSSPTVKKRQHRSCQSGCNISNPATLTRSSSSTTTLSSSSSVSSMFSGGSSSNELRIGQKVSVTSLCAIGTIRFLGSTAFQRGLWAGIEMDIVGTGKNDGSIKGSRYFHCRPETGLFILASKVTPLKDASSSRSSSTTTHSSHGQQQRPSKTPSKRATLSTARPRQRCLSSDPKPTASVSASAPKKKTTPSLTSSSTSTRTPRSQSSTTISPLVGSTRKSSAPPPLNTSVKVLQRKSVTPVLSTHQRKSATPVLSSSPNPIKSTRQPVTPTTPPHTSKSTRRTVTPTTNKKPSSTGPLTKQQQPPSPSHHGNTPRRSKSTSTRQVVTQDELDKMHKLLEQSRQEKQRLSDEMNGKEAVWERLVTAKESYALRVQDMQVEITRLQDSLQLSQQHVTHLESQLTNQATMTTISSPTAACSPITIHPDSTMVEQHYNRRIEKLDRLVREWQHDAQKAHQQLQQQQRTHNAQMDQLRRDLAERDQATATMERDCEAVKQANVDMIWHYETMLKEWNVDREKVLKAKDDHIDRLGQVIEELKACHFLLPPSPNNDDDDDDDDDEDSVASIIPDLVRKLSLNATTTTTTSTTSKHNLMYSSRRRLEQQLELTTMALDEIQQQQKATLQENEQLRDQLSHMHAASSAMDQQCHQLQNELSKEINHKRLVMEERDAALQGQLRMDDEHEDLEMTNTRLELQLKQLEEERQDDSQVRYKGLQEAHDALEQECGRLMDQILSDDDHRLALEARIAQLEEAERQRVQQLERIETASLSSTTTSSTVSSQQRRRRSSKPIPFAMNHCSGIIMPDHQPPKRSSTSRVASYCEICEVHGHDVLGCKAHLMDGNSTIYCVNCDVFDTHSTADCPNHDETF